jgi:hypothetical protein
LLCIIFSPLSGSCYGKRWKCRVWDWRDSRDKACHLLLKSEDSYFPVSRWTLFLFYY